MPNTDLTLQNCLAGSLLISTPKQTDGPFEETVIYIYEHSPQTGAQGVVINRQSGITVEDLLERMNYTGGNISLKSPLYHGGLTDENGVLMIHTSEWYSSNTRPVDQHISVSSDMFMIEKLINGNEPRNWMMCAGKCLWEPGEIDVEVLDNYWLTAPATKEIIFSPHEDSRLWRDAIDHCTSHAVNSWF
jgi:putative transcriptional regulator